jgi:signal transduction histidine kinase
VRSDVVSGVLFTIGSLTLITCVVVSTVLLVLRFRRSRGDERQQLKWFLFASSFVLVTTIALNLFESPPLLLSVATVFALVLLSITVAIAVLKYRLFDIDVVIRKTVIFAILAGLIVTLGIGALVIAGVAIGRPSNDERLLIALGALLGIAIWPLRRVATVFADKIVFGGRRTPYEVLTEFSNRVGETYSSEDVLRRMAQVVGKALGARAAVIWLRVAETFQPAATWPADAETPGSVPKEAVQVRHQGEVLGAIFVTMPANDPMSDAKRGLISDLARQAGPVLRNVRLVEELRESRRRIVAAADERARTLERNIHDGAQQQLVALAVKQRIAASLVGNDDDRARSILEELQTETNAALDDLRDLARGIYPPLLADQGLVAALTAQARKAALPVEVDADGIGRFGQDVEAAVYFSCLEALQNVAKYAEASLATVVLHSTGAHLTFEVRDDGLGFDSRATRGTGLQGIDDRLSALGGELHIRSSPGTGTTIEGTVPTGGFDHSAESGLRRD